MTSAPPPVPSTRRTTRRAFTLIELILVLVVLTIIVGMTLPAMQGMAKGRGAETCAGEMLALAHYARSQAIAEGVPYRLNVDVSQGTYYLSKYVLPEPGDTRQVADYYPLEMEMGSIFDIPPDVTVEWDYAFMEQQLTSNSETGRVVPLRDTTNVPYVQFLPSGRTDPVLIRITDREGKITQVICPSPTETVRLILPDGTVRN